MHDLAIPETASPATAAEQLAEFAEFAEFRRDTIQAVDTGDSLLSELEQRVAALEEVLAARGPARLIAGWRLGRRIRQSADAFAWVGPSFYWRRAEAVHTEWLAGR